jgi:iron-sulfur cluster insertion protein
LTGKRNGYGNSHGTHVTAKSDRPGFRAAGRNRRGDGRSEAVARRGGRWWLFGFQYSITLDEPAPDDLVLEKGGQRVLVDQISLPFLANAVIDFTDELIGARFVVENPNAKSSCGCGTSFSL